MGNKEKRPASTPTKVREGVKRIKMTPRSGGSVVIPKGNGNAKTN